MTVEAVKYSGGTADQALTDVTHKSAGEIEELAVGHAVGEARVLDYRQVGQEPIEVFGIGSHISDFLGDEGAYKLKVVSEDQVEVDSIALQKRGEIGIFDGNLINLAGFFTYEGERINWRETEPGDYPELA